MHRCRKGGGRREGRGGRGKHGSRRWRACDIARAAAAGTTPSTKERIGQRLGLALLSRAQLGGRLGGHGVGRHVGRRGVPSSVCVLLQVENDECS